MVANMDTTISPEFSGVMLHGLNTSSVLLTEEGVQACRAHARREHDRQVGAQPVAADLDRAVDELVDRAGRAFHPRLPPVGSEELRCLDDGHVRVLEMRQRFGEEIRPGSEIGVEYDEELAPRVSEGLPEVSRFLILTAIGAYDITEAEV